MNWWYWTWVLYSATIAATLRARFFWGERLLASGDGIGQFKKRKRLRLPPWGLASDAVTWTGQPGTFWRATVWTATSCIAPVMAWASKYTRIPGWRKGNPAGWSRETWLP